MGKRLLKRSAMILFIGIMTLTGLFWTDLYQVEGATAGSKGTTLYDNILIGKDGKEYWVKGRSENIVYDRKGKATRTAPFTSELRIRNFEVRETSGAKVLGYCVEWGVPYEKGVTYSAASAVSDSYYKLLPARTREGIKLATLYGYRPGRRIPVSGCNAADWYMATQVIVWEYQQLLRSSPTKIASRTGMPADYFSKNIKGRPAEACYKFMLSRMNMNYKTTSFAGTKVHLMKYNDATQDYRVTLTDTHRIAFAPRFTSDTISLSRTGNQYTFIAKEPIDVTTLRFQHDIPPASGPNLIWGSLQSGQVLMTGIENDFTYSARFRTEADGNFQLEKKSEDGKIEGVEFEISGVNLDEPLLLATDERGMFSIDLIPGTYIVREIPNEMYLPTEPQTIIIEEGKAVSVVFDNTPIVGEVEISKSDVSDGKLIPDCGIEILDEEMNVLFQGRTDDTGKVLFSNLPKGDYYFREFDAPKGYLIDENPYPFTVAEHGEVVKCSMTNERVEEPKEVSRPGPELTKAELAKATKTPKTGDTTSLPFWIGLMFGGLILATFTFLKAKK